MKNKNRSFAAVFFMFMYYIAVVAPPEIDKKIFRWKKLLYDRFGCRAALKSPSHITLVAPFWMNEALEEDLRYHLQQISIGQPDMRLTLRNFGAFPPRVIYVAVEQNEDLYNLHSRTNNDLFGTGKFPIETDLDRFHPHVTIAARDLQKRHFQQAWEIFERKKFIAEWNVAGISLLRHNKKNWDVISTSQFAV